MPNWCQNILTVTGPAKEIDQFISQNRGDSIKGEFLLFSKSAPEPSKECYVSGHLYHQDMTQELRQNWRNKHWGTTTEPKSFELDVQKKEVNSKEIKTVTYKFRTAWNPGNIWCQKMIEKYRELRFCLIYGDTGSDFSGIVVGAGGKITGLDEGPVSEYLSKRFD